MSEYNGWANWETWNVALWVTNDGEYVYQEARSAARRGPSVIREYVEEYVGLDKLSGTLAGDLVAGQLASVDWYEVAENLSDGTGECDTCGEEYQTASRDGRCGDCGDCADCCEHKV